MFRAACSRRARSGRPLRSRSAARAGLVFDHDLRPSDSPVLAPTMRAMMSDGPPAAKPTTMRIGLLGSGLRDGEARTPRQDRMRPRPPRPSEALDGEAFGDEACCFAHVMIPTPCPCPAHACPARLAA